MVHLQIRSASYIISGMRIGTSPRNLTAVNLGSASRNFKLHDAQLAFGFSVMNLFSKFTETLVGEMNLKSESCLGCKINGCRVLWTK